MTFLQAMRCKDVLAMEKRWHTCFMKSVSKQERGMFMFKKNLAKILVVAALTLSALIAVSTTSYAATSSPESAYGIQYWGGFHVNVGGQSIGIPAGQLAHWISGDGYYVSWDGANFASAADICDTSMRFTYGNGSQYINGGIHQGCSHVGQWKYTLNRNVPGGSACAALYADDWRILVARQCHFVY